MPRWIASGTLSIGYPDYEAQMDILRQRQTVNPLDSVRGSLTQKDVLRMQQEVRNVTAKDIILIILPGWLWLPASIP